MPVLLPKQQMAASELRGIAKFHQSTAAMFRQRSELSTAKQFEDLAAGYLIEIARREEPEGWDDPDR